MQSTICKQARWVLFTKNSYVRLARDKAIEIIANKPAPLETGYSAKG
jgi:hypothetical protein